MRSRTSALAPAVTAITICAAVAGGACGAFSADERPVTADADAGADGAAVDAPPPGTDEASTQGEGGDPGPDAVTLSSMNDELLSVAATETTVYFASPASGKIFEVPIDGGATTTFLDNGESPSCVAVADNVVFWSDRAKLRIGKRNVGGGSPSTYDVSPAPTAIAASVVGGAVQIVFPTVDKNNGNIGTVQVLGGDFGPIQTTGQPFANGYDIAIESAQVWWTESGAGSIWQWSIESPPPVPAVRASGQSGCESIAADAEGVYWTRQQDGLVNWMRPPSSGVDTLAKGQMEPYGIAADASGVYWLTSDGKLKRSKRQLQDAPPPEIISSGFKGGVGNTHGKKIALTSKYVVWITEDGKVLRHDK